MRHTHRKEAAQTCIDPDRRQAHTGKHTRERAGQKGKMRPDGMEEHTVQGVSYKAHDTGSQQLKSILFTGAH